MKSLILIAVLISITFVAALLNISKIGIGKVYVEDTGTLLSELENDKCFCHSESTKSFCLVRSIGTSGMERETAFLYDVNGNGRSGNASYKCRGNNGRSGTNNY